MDRNVWRVGIYKTMVPVSALLWLSCDGEPAPDEPSEGSAVSYEDALAVQLPVSEDFEAFRQGKSVIAPVAAGLAEGQPSYGFIPSPVHVPVAPASASAPKAKVKAALQTVPPAKHDLRTTGKLSGIRNQGGCGSCWAFAAYAATESQLLPGEVIDLSEEHLNNLHGFDVPPCQGGNADIAIAYLARWSGAVLEEDAPYTGTVSKISQTAPVSRHLEEALTIPARTGATDNDSLKDAVMTHGAVMTTMRHDAAAYNASTAGFYVPTKAGYSNHAVAIVGWDDAFPASKFRTRPPGNGAFIIRNSWGPGFGEQGYFYISYYDAFVGRTNKVFTVMAAPNNFRRVYQYDKYGFSSAAVMKSSIAYMANIYTATADGVLQAVSYYTAAPDTTALVSLYSGPIGANPASGALLGTLQSDHTLAGYHTVRVAHLGATVKAGAKFSVVLKLSGTGTTTPFALEYPYKGYSAGVSVTPGTTFYGSNGTHWYDGATFGAGANMPIKVFANDTTNCDDGNPCTTDSGTPGSCVNTPVPAGTICRASSGVCDVAEACDGTAKGCPTDRFIAASTVCRAATGACDAAELCSGQAAACPGDALKSKGTVCRAGAGSCDLAEACDGQSALCPQDTVSAAGTACRASTGPCDVAEQCDGVAVACPADQFVTAGTACRAAVGPCDAAEVCTGASGACPANKLAASGTTCRPAAGPCDTAEVCNGKATTCPKDSMKSSATVCRAANGPCDAAEKCTGKSVVCPVDAVAAAGKVCRSAAGTCDVADKCDGLASVCPADALKPAGTVCRSASSKNDVAEMCSGVAPACPPNAFKK